MTVSNMPELFTVAAERLEFDRVPALHNVYRGELMAGLIRVTSVHMS